MEVKVKNVKPPGVGQLSCCLTASGILSTHVMPGVHPACVRFPLLLLKSYPKLCGLKDTNLLFYSPEINLSRLKIKVLARPHFFLSF